MDRHQPRNTRATAKETLLLGKSTKFPERPINRKSPKGTRHDCPRQRRELKTEQGRWSLSQNGLNFAAQDLRLEPIVQMNFRRLAGTLLKIGSGLVNP